uniref:Secreted protein n=1 Tax=Panagrolaimus sp. JU765 TaxID=591449 RepID=A0AC34RAS8_9BILA
MCSTVSIFVYYLANLFLLFLLKSAFKNLFFLSQKRRAIIDFVLYPQFLHIYQKSASTITHCMQPGKFLTVKRTIYEAIFC